MEQTLWVEQVETYSLMLEKTGGLDDLYVATGKQLFMVGDQNGMFPALGAHIPGDMAGIWTHPIKLLDGFWVRLNGPGGEFWLEKADKFVVGPGFCEHGYTLPELGLTVTRREWVPDELPGLVVEFSFKNERAVETPLELQILVHSNLRATWRAEELQIRDGEDDLEFIDDLNAVCAEDTLNGWAVVFGTDRTPSYHLLGPEVQGRQSSGGEHGGGGDLHYTIDIPSKGWFNVRFIATGSTESRAAAIANYQDLMASHPIYFEEKMARYAEVANNSRLECPEEAINEAFLWAKLNYQILEAETPVGNALISGFHELPWFNGVDICMAVPAMLAVGRQTLVRDSLSLLAKYAASAYNGEDAPNEITTLGSHFPRQNLVALPLFCIALDQYAKWSGDRNFLGEHLPLAANLFKRFQTDKQGLNIVQRGPGVIERPGYQNHRLVDTACLQLEGMRALESMYLQAGDATLAHLVRRKHEVLEITIAKSYYLPEQGLFADLCAPKADIQKMVNRIASRLKGVTPEQVNAHFPTERLILGSEEAVPEGVMYGWVGRNWTSVLPMLVGAATWQQAMSALPKMESGHFMSTWGMMTQGAADKKVTPIGTGAMACAQLRYGRGDQGIQTVKRMALSLKHEMPGAFAEFLPDAGCCIRAHSGMGLIWSMVHYVMGVRPNLVLRYIDFMPRLPDSWAECLVEDMKIGELVLSFAATRGDNWAEAIIKLETHGFTTFMAVPVPFNSECRVGVNGREQRKWDTEERKLHGIRFMGAKVDLAPGMNVMRVEWV
ncbi:MAG: hypothetical protein FJX76_11035 [Armatimonadetes bacterium]|nr:hypothetical protein [Armatimonadota bacterium]